ncbi:MAG: sigma 54-interacting transcriptional regulator [Bdellovibrionota bacterium]
MSQVTEYTRKSSPEVDTSALAPIDWDQVKKLRVTRKINEALGDLGIHAVYITPSNRRKDARKKYLGYGPKKMLVHAEKVFFAGKDSQFVQMLTKYQDAFEQYRENCADIIEEALETKDIIKKEDSFGLTQVAISIYAGKEIVGVIRCGNFVNGKLDDLIIAKILENLSHYKMTSRDVEQEVRHLQFFSSEKVAVVTNLLQMMAQEIGGYLEETLKESVQTPEMGQHNFDGLISKSPSILEILRQIRLIGASGSSVIIYGESGTGKELIANLIHKNSKRADQPFVTINCAALTETLLEAELFGYKKGAFTGAIADKKGLFEVADNGTVFLDEVGEMSLSLQVKILRLIQEGTFMRVGDTQTRQVDVRVISATHRDLRKFIELGKFREDLYYRLAVVELTLPPLRDRTDDIPLLANHFLQEFTQKTGKSGIKLSSEVSKTFFEYFWPGNVRELRNEIERIVALSASDSLIRSQDLSKKFFYETYPENIQVSEEEGEGFIKKLVDDFERSLLSKYLQKHKWNKTKVARLCGITRQGLNKKISKYRLDRRRM